MKAVRGTSFAVPLVAARAAAALEQGRAVRPALDAEARDLGRKGRTSSLAVAFSAATARADQKFPFTFNRYSTKFSPL